MKRIGIILAVVIAIAAWFALHRTAPKQAGSSKLAPAFSLKDTAGHPMQLSDYRGKVVVLDFWATWCEPCKEEIPQLVDLQNRYGAQGLQVLGISMDDSEDPVREFQQKYKMNYPIAVGTSQVADEYGGVLGLPITFVIDKQGQIVSRHIGATAPAVFEEEIKRLQ
jgi:peroxiredoxin